LNNIGIVYANNGEYEKAIQYLKDCLSKRKQSSKKNDIDIGICYTNLGVIYLTLQQFDNASKYFHLALKSFQLNKSNIFQAILYQNMAQLFQQTNLFNKSLQFYQDALLIFKQFKPPNHPNITFIQQQIHLLKQLK
jgi:tetratricopeptide (TPR) repeat protein